MASSAEVTRCPHTCRAEGVCPEGWGRLRGKPLTPVRRAEAQGEDRPGVMGEVSRKLGDAVVSINLVYLATNTRLMFRRG